MPRQPRLDAPGALHHVMGRGIERTNIFRINRDQDDFLNRLANLCTEGNLIVYAWCLLSNHFHLLVRTGRQSISRSMKKLLTGYVVNFNLRHKRTGHLFQNRYKSIICEEDTYLLELTRYIHLNPLRAGVGNAEEKSSEGEEEVLSIGGGKDGISWSRSCSFPWGDHFFGQSFGCF